ncbi:MAG: PQQ-dependent sugar dehydrogenase [Acidobacteria bacterium]|nr:PQQ-dependent sugar dehydrogenase [Acidobacteriota bacterium]
MKSYPFRNRQTQRGAVLIMGLLLLVIITILAVSGMNTATTGLAMARNDQNYENAFQAAETGLENALSQGRFNTIGGDRGNGSGPTGQGNLISGNTFGIALWGGASNNTVTGNVIGTEASGSIAWANNVGILLMERSNDNTIGPYNVIAFNAEFGLSIQSDSLVNTIILNSIHSNAVGDVDLYSQANSEVDPPLVFDFDLAAGTVTGAACAGCTVKIYSDADQAIPVFEGQTTSNNLGGFDILDKDAPFTGPNLTATATDADGNTSEFSASVSVVTPIDDPIPEPIPHSGIPVRLEPVVDGLIAPNWGAPLPGHDGRLMVTDQDGILWAVDLATSTKSVFLDVSGRLVALRTGGDERGLLGVAFHPDYANNGLLYTYTSEPVDGPADFSTMPTSTTADHQSVIVEWHVPNPADSASVADTSSARVLLSIDQPQRNHNAGALSFGPDGMLYISLGDGGSGDDQGVGHGTSGNGQDAGNVLGTILRIDPLATSSANGQYGVPADNPFVGQAGMVDEIFAYGLRNPFRFSFDSAGGDMYIADVGQGDIEEIDLGVSGGNYGWNLKEGSFFFDANGGDPSFVTNVDPGVPAGLVDPIAEYDHDEGAAIIGGFVYRGGEFPTLDGSYVFGDFSRTFSNDGRLFHLRAGEIVEFPIIGQDGLGLSLLGFGQDADGEVYVLGNTTGTPFGAGPGRDLPTGVVLKLTPARCGDLNGDGLVNVFDAIILLQIIVGLAPQSDDASVLADLNRDGQTNVFDAILVLQHIVGLTEISGCGPP